MRLRKLNLIKVRYIMMILIIFSEFFIMHGVSLASDNNIVITEIMYDLAGSDIDREWFEIYNKSESLNLAGWKIFDKSNHPLKLFNTENFIINKSEYVIIAKNGDKFKEDYFLNNKKEFEYKIFESNINLVNTTGEIRVINTADIYEATYSSDIGGAGNGFSLELDKDNFFRESFVEGGTPGEKNSEKGVDNYINEDINTIRINEIFPNPKDENEEFIELYNSGNKDVDLSGWFLKDLSRGSGYEFDEGVILKAEEFVVVYKGDSGISLNNSGKEGVFLLDKNKKQVDFIEYNGTKEGLSYGFDQEGCRWRWSDLLTPGTINEFKEAGEVLVDIDDDIYKDIYANFEVRVGSIKEKDLKVKWEFGDGKKSYKSKTRHKYLNNGKYTLKLSVYNGTEDIKKEFNIEVDDFPERKISILAISPNPKGRDAEGEWIELKNKSKKKLNLKNWSIATGENKKKLVNHPIYDNFIIKAGKVKQINKKESNFSLNNKKGYVELRYPNGEVAYKIKYKKEDGVKDDEVYRKKDGGGWEWLIGKTNINKQVSDVEKEIEIIEIRDVDLMLETKPEDIGKISKKERRDDLKSNLVIDFYQKKENELQSYILKDKYVLGALDIKNKKIREEGGVYYFNPKSKEQKHYLIRFWEDILKEV